MLCTTMVTTRKPLNRNLPRTRNGLLAHCTTTCDYLIQHVILLDLAKVLGTHDMVKATDIQIEVVPQHWERGQLLHEDQRRLTYAFPDKGDPRMNAYGVSLFMVHKFKYLIPLVSMGSRCRTLKRES
jgi:hypothetical protein